MFENQCW